MRLRRYKKPRILLIADVPNWIFARHCQTIKKLLSDEFAFTVKMFGDDFNEADYDLIYPLEFNLVDSKKIGNPAKYVTGIRGHISWQNLDFKEFTTSFTDNFQRVHVVSERLMRALEESIPNLTNVSHGVDTGFFKPGKVMQSSHKGKLVLGFAGNRNTKTKGFEEFIAPLGNIPGVELKFCGYDSKNLNTRQMRQFYQSIDAYVCASPHEGEGNNNSLMEAAAMERAIITTDNGTVPEYLKDGYSALIVERKLPDLTSAVVRLRDNVAMRTKLGKMARPGVVKAFDWQQAAQNYRRFFRDALQNRDS